MQCCPRCDSEKTVKNGNHLGRQRHRCRGCGFQFTRKTPRGRAAHEKAAAVLLYTMGLPFSTIARIYGTAPSSVMRWVQSFAEKNTGKPEPGQAVIVELDAMWLSLHAAEAVSGNGQIIVAIPVSSLTGNMAIATTTLMQT